MKNIGFYLSLILLGFVPVFISCENEDDIGSKLELLDNEDYFPLHLGNFWELTKIPKMTIDTNETLDGKNYFRMVTAFDTVYYRKTTDGKVYERTKASDEILKFDLSANADDTWTYHDETFEEGWHVTLVSKTETVELDGVTFENCYRFYFDVPSWADEAHSIWLAPGIGIIEQSFAYGTAGGKVLEKAKIDGVELEF